MPVIAAVEFSGLVIRDNEQYVAKVRYQSTFYFQYRVKEG